MRETVVTIEPTRTCAELVDGRVTMAIETGDAQLHVRRPTQSPIGANDVAATIAIAGAGGDLEATIELAQVDVKALDDAFTDLLGSVNNG